MRIIGGKLSSRIFNPPIKDWDTKPTTDKAREGLFNILKDHLEFQGMQFLDLFSGSGAHTYEVLSRGGQSAVCVDSDPSCIAYIKRTLKNFGIEEQARLIRADVFKYIESDPMTYDLIFADPPYKERRIPQLPDMIFQSTNKLNKDGMFVLEHDKFNNFNYHSHFIGQRQYRQSHFSFFR